MGKFEIDCSFWIRLFTLFTGYSEPPSAGCKQYTVGFPALDNSSSTATAEIAVNGMDPPELGFSPAESTTGTSGQSWHKKSSSHTQAAAKNLCFFSIRLKTGNYEQLECTEVADWVIWYHKMYQQLKIQDFHADVFTKLFVPRGKFVWEPDETLAKLRDCWVTSNL